MNDDVLKQIIGSVESTLYYAGHKPAIRVDVVKMIELAGDVATKAGYLLKCVGYEYVTADKLLWVHFQLLNRESGLPVDHSVVRTVNLTFEERLFAEQPDAPIIHVHINFVEKL